MININSLEDSLNLIISEKHLEREFAYKYIKNNQLNDNNFTQEQLELIQICQINNINSIEWQKVSSSFRLAEILLQFNFTKLEHSEVIKKIYQQIRHDEFRVRTSVSYPLKYIMKTQDETLLEDFNDLIVQCFEESNNREIDPSTCVPNEEDYNDVKNLNIGEDSPSGTPRAKLSPRNSNVSRLGALVPDNQGWQYLETTLMFLRNLQESVLQSETPLSKSLLDPNMFNMIYESTNHINRQARETGLYCLREQIKVLIKMKDNYNDEVINQLNQISNVLGKLLMDNWSQVRMAASKTCRVFLDSQPFSQHTHQYPLIFPKICLNRFQIAEGVKLYNIKMWKDMTVIEDKAKGIDIILSNLSSFIEQYLSQTKADNHAVREAACLAIQELIIKVAANNKDEFIPQVSNILIHLLDCFKDMSWPVRDSACISCAHVMQIQNQQLDQYLTNEQLTSLYLLFEDHLSDNIPSVRQNAAYSTGLLFSVGVFKEKITSHIDSMMQAIKEQTKADEADDDEQVDKNVYSCGSLAPKLSRGGCGCTDIGNTKRTKKPQEITEGILQLLKEISKYDTQFVGDRNEQILEVINLQSFKNPEKQQNNCNECVKDILENQKKNTKQWKSFKGMYLDEYIKQTMNLFIRSSNVNVKTSSARLIESISKNIGPSILKGRLELLDPEYTNKFQEMIKYIETTVQVTDFNQDNHK